MGCCVSSNDQQRSFVAVNGNGSGAQGQGTQNIPPAQNPHRSNAGDRGGRSNGGGAQQQSASNGGGAQIGSITYLQNPAVEIILKGQATGEGVKRTPAYETPKSRKELEKWRQEFWETRTQGHPHIWQILRNACEETAENAEAMILAAGLKIPQQSLTLAIDEGGVFYRVPICCINDPEKYNANKHDDVLKGKNKPAEKVLNNLKIRTLGKGDFVVQTTNLTSIADVKKLALQKMGEVAQGQKLENLRFLCLGKELSDELFIYSYGIEDEMTIQAMFKQSAAAAQQHEAKK